MNYLNIIIASYVRLSPVTRKFYNMFMDKRLLETWLEYHLHYHVFKKHLNTLKVFFNPGGQTISFVASIQEGGTSIVNLV